MIHLVLKGTSDDVRVSIASGSIGSAVLYEGLVVRMVVRFSCGISQFMEKMHVCLEGVTMVW
jgi:hypothetical protein